MANLKKLNESIISGDLETSVQITKEALAEKNDPQEIIQEYMIPAMDIIGGCCGTTPEHINAMMKYFRTSNFTGQVQ